MNLRLAAALAVWGGLLAGCGGLRSDAPADRIYILRTAVTAGVRPTVQAVLVVPRPAVQPGLDTERIALTRPGNELDYFASSRWGESLPKVLGAFAVESMASAFATVVGAERGGVAADFELLLTARHFEAQYGGGGVPVARVSFECVLVTGAPRRVLNRCDADVTEPAAANRMADIITALERAAQQAMEEVRSKVQAVAR